MSTTRQNQPNYMCVQRRLRSSWACAQSDQSLCCPHEETLSLGLKLPIERTAKTLIRLGGCPGWSESSMDTLVILLLLSCRGSNVSLFVLNMSSKRTYLPHEKLWKPIFVWFVVLRSNQLLMSRSASLLTLFGTLIPKRLVSTTSTYFRQ